jgi:hypothetical protein
VEDGQIRQAKIDHKRLESTPQPPQNALKDQVKVAELEAELGRVRVFYTRKIEDLQKKYEQRIWRLKRAEGDENDEPMKVLHHTPTHDSTSPTTIKLQQKLDAQQSRINVLESQLVEVTTELTQTRNTLLIETRSIQQLEPPAQSQAFSAVDLEAQVTQLVQKRLDKLCLIPSSSHPLTQSSNSQNKNDMQREEGIREKEQYICKLEQEVEKLQEALRIAKEEFQTEREKSGQLVTMVAELENKINQPSPPLHQQFSVR